MATANEGVSQSIKNGANFGLSLWAYLMPMGGMLSWSPNKYWTASKRQGMRVEVVLEKGINAVPMTSKTPLCRQIKRPVQKRRRQVEKTTGFLATKRLFLKKKKRPQRSMLRHSRLK